VKTVGALLGCGHQHFWSDTNPDARCNCGKWAWAEYARHRDLTDKGPDDVLRGALGEVGWMLRGGRSREELARQKRNAYWDDYLKNYVGVLGHVTSDPARTCLIDPPRLATSDEIGRPPVPNRAIAEDVPWEAYVRLGEVLRG
jgi:hypothetical protein